MYTVTDTIETMISTPKVKESGLLVGGGGAIYDSSVGCMGSTGNHLGLPRPPESNPNLLSPEILNQRRGLY